MTTPSIVPINRKGDYRDFLQTKCDRGGDNRTEGVSVSIPSGTVVTTVVGLLPFNRGFRFDMGATQLALATALGASVTLDIGYVYNDNVTYTNDPDAFASAISGNAIGALAFDEFVTGVNWVADADGWIAITVGGATTATTGIVTGQIVGVYDGLALINR